MTRISRDRGGTGRRGTGREGTGREGTGRRGPSTGNRSTGTGRGPDFSCAAPNRAAALSLRLSICIGRRSGHAGRQSSSASVDRAAAPPGEGRRRRRPATIAIAEAVTMGVTVARARVRRRQWPPCARSRCFDVVGGARGRTPPLRSAPLFPLFFFSLSLRILPIPRRLGSRSFLRGGGVRRVVRPPRVSPLVVAGRRNAVPSLEGAKGGWSNQNKGPCRRAPLHHRTYHRARARFQSEAARWRGGWWLCRPPSPPVRQPPT